MRLLAIIPLLVMLDIAKSDKLWECNFEENDCWAASSTRNHERNQLTLHWNRWKMRTPTGATASPVTGPMMAFEGKHYLYYEATESMDKLKMADGASKGVVTFKDINLMGRTQFILSFYYQVKGNDGDFYDFDLMVSNTENTHYDLSMKSIDGKDWKHFKHIMKVEGAGVTSIDLKFTARSYGAFADYAIDNIVIEDYPDAGPCKDNRCLANEYCTITSSTQTVCVAKCTQQACGENAECILDSLAINKCKCRQGYLPRVSNYGDKLNCYRPDASCDIEYNSLGQCRISTSIPIMYGHPSLWHGRYSPVSGNGYYVFKYDNTITLDPVSSQKLSFFYLVDNPNMINSLTVEYGSRKFEVPINREKTNIWTLYEVLILASTNQRVQIKASFYAEGGVIGIDNIQFTQQNEVVVEKIYKESMMAATFEDGSVPTDLKVAMLFVTRYGKIDFGCLPGIELETRNGKLYCKDGVVQRQSACSQDSDCTGSNARCVLRNCVCNTNSYQISIGTYGEKATSCAVYPCEINSPRCHSTAICSNIKTPGQNFYNDYTCKCGRSLNNVETIINPFIGGDKSTQCLAATPSDSYVCNDNNFKPSRTTEYCLKGNQATVEYSLRATNFGNYALFKHCDDPDDEYRSSFNDPGSFWRPIDLVAAANENLAVSVTYKTSLSNKFIKCNFEQARFGTKLTLAVNVNSNSRVLTFTNTQTSVNKQNPVYQGQVFQSDNPTPGAEMSVTFTVTGNQAVDQNVDAILLDNVVCKGFDDVASVNTPCGNNACASNQYCNPLLSNSEKECLCPTGQKDQNCPDVVPSGSVVSSDGPKCIGHHEKYMNGACVCDDGFEKTGDTCTVKINCGCNDGLCLSGDKCSCPLNLLKVNQACVRTNKDCAKDCVSTLGNGGYCDVTTGMCDCLTGFVKSGRDDGSYRCDKHAVVQKINDPKGICSATCGTGFVNEIEVCVGATGTGFECMTNIVQGTLGVCSLPACPATSSQCSIQKECACNNVRVPIGSDGKLRLDFDHEAKLNMIFRFLSKHNQKDLEFKFREARCDNTKLDSIARTIEDDLKQLEFDTELQAAITTMKSILDCSPSGNDHNAAYWDVFDMLIELSSYRPHAVSDLQLKKELVMHEQSRCGMRSNLHKVVDGYAFWNKK